MELLLVFFLILLLGSLGYFDVPTYKRIPVPEDTKVETKRKTKQNGGIFSFLQRLILITMIITI